MASTDAYPVPKKNTAYRFTFAIFKNDGTLITGATGLDSQVSIDGGTYAACTNEATEIGSSGTYYLDLTAGEMNGNTIVVVTTSTSTGAVPVPTSIYPQEAGDIKVSMDAGGIVAASFASGAVDAAALNADAATEIATAVFNTVIEAQGSVTAGSALKLMLAVLAGVTTVSGATYTVKTSNGAATRVTFTLNSSKERTAVTLAP